MKKANDDGFSLIELIIVIAIMAVLVAIVAPNLSRYLGSSKKAVDKKNLDEIKHQTTTCISEAVIDKIEIINGEDGLKTAKYILEYDSSQGKVVATAGTNGVSQFANLLTSVFSETDVKSKLNNNYDKVQIIISGQQSAGYSVVPAFIS